MAGNKLIDYLDSHNIKYKVIKVRPEYTAQETAASAHISGSQLAKTVLLKVDGVIVMAVLPAPFRVNFDRFKELTGAKQIELASEAQFKDLFPDCELGAMPPFGNLYDMPVYAAENLAEEIEIVFCAGSHSKLVRLPFKDFNRLVNPQVLDFAWKP